MLAYQFVQVIRSHLGSCQNNASWSSIRQTLSGQCLVTANFRRADGGALHIRKATRAEPEQLAICQILVFASAVIIASTLTSPWIGTLLG